jgi:hypothetical protein
MNEITTILNFLQDHPEVAFFLFVAALAGWFMPNYDGELDTY